MKTRGDTKRLGPELTCQARMLLWLSCAIWLLILAIMISAVSADVHRISCGVHPAQLTQLGLAVALNRYCLEVQTAHHIAIRFTARDVPHSLREDAALCVYRVTQEAVQNIVKRNGAKTVTVELIAENNVIHLNITDDGRGFEVGAKRATASLGLISMSERVRLVRGRIAVNSKPGQGTRVTVLVPLQNESSA